MCQAIELDGVEIDKKKAKYFYELAVCSHEWTVYETAKLLNNSQLVKVSSLMLWSGG